MSRYITRIKTDEGELYCLYNDSTGTIDSPFFASSEDIALFLCQTRQEFEKLLSVGETADVEFSFSKKKMPELLSAIGNLKNGNSIDNEEIMELLAKLDSIIVSLIKETELEEELSKWVRELGLREEYPVTWDTMDIFDDCRGNVCFGDNTPSSKQNQLIGRYFEKMIQIIGTNNVYENLRELLGLS